MDLVMTADLGCWQTVSHHPVGTAKSFWIRQFLNPNQGQKSKSKLRENLEQNREQPYYWKSIRRQILSELSISN